MKRIAAITGALWLGLTFVCGAAPADGVQEDGKAPVFITSTDMTLSDGPPSLPKGAQIAVLDGDPTKEGHFEIRLKFPANYKVPPHFHPTDERLTVISGTLYVALGDTFDPSKAKALKPGSFVMLPRRSHHFAFAKEETVFQLNGMGPFDITYLNPSDDPRNK